MVDLATAGNDNYTITPNNNNSNKSIVDGDIRGEVVEIIAK